MAGPSSRTRRAGQGRATNDEIVLASTRMLAEGEGLSLRGVASRMGVTAPALYRYVASYQELIAVVSSELDRRAHAAVEARAAAYPRDDSAARLIAACVAFRSWTLNHPHEFALVFANPSTCERGQDGPVEGWPFPTSGRYIFALVHQTWQQHRPPGSDVDGPRGPMKEAPDRTGPRWIGTRLCATLYGLVALEASGHLPRQVLGSGDLLRAQLLDLIDVLGTPTERDRMVAILDNELEATEPRRDWAPLGRIALRPESH